jgi:hypothetical protein
MKLGWPQNRFGRGGQQKIRCAEQSWSLTVHPVAVKWQTYSGSSASCNGQHRCRWDFRFSRRRVWKWLSLGCCAVQSGTKLPTFQRCLAASIIRAISLMMEVASTCQTSVNFYETTRRNNPEDSHLHWRRYLVNILITNCRYRPGRFSFRVHVNVSVYHSYKIWSSLQRGKPGRHISCGRLCIWYCGIRERHILHLR